jgi:putative transcriptional regulator
VAGSSLAPAFLVAMPQLRDPNFRRTVVLLVHHDEEGTFGVVLNRPTGITAPDLCSTLDVEWYGAPDAGIGWGGPVQPQTGWLLFGRDDDVGLDGDEDVRSVGQGIHFAGSLEVLRRVALNPPDDVRLLLGYAGWGPGQLESELAEGAWLIAPVTREAVFEVEDDELWEHVVRSLGIEPSTLIASRGVH